MMTLTHDQMLAQWKLRHYMEPLREDCEVTRYDGVNVDSLIALAMQDWYLHLLDTAPLKMVPLTDLANETAQIDRPETGAVVVKLPENVRRVVAVNIEGCPQDIVPVTDMTDYRVALQKSEYSRGGRCEPVAVLSAGGILTVYGEDESGKLPVVEHIYAVVLPEANTYIFDESALSTIHTVEI